MSTLPPRERAIGALKIGSSMPIREIKHRNVDDGAKPRVHGLRYHDGEVATNHKWAHRYVDVVIPSHGVEHASGLILRFVAPEDLETLQAVLDDALELLRERRPATSAPPKVDINVQRGPATPFVGFTS